MRLHYLDSRSRQAVSATNSCTRVLLQGAGRLMPPLGHLGFAQGRDEMHKDLVKPATLTYSMWMFSWGWT